MIQNAMFATKGNKSISYKIALVVIILGYLVFFNAKYFLPDNSTVFNTDIGTVNYIGSTKVAINRWEYNKQKGFMEVELKYEETNDTIGSKLKFSAKPKSNTALVLNVKTIIVTDDTYIIHIENIPDDYKAVALKVSQTSNSSGDVVDDSSADSTDFSTSNINSTTDDSANTKTSSNATLYADYRKVKINNNLKVETEKSYLAQLTKREIKNLGVNMKKYQTTINKNTSMISSYNDKIADLNSQMKYEIPEDQEKTSNKINDCNSKIKNLDSNNSDLENTKNLTKDKIAKLNLKVNDIQSQKK